MYEFFLRFLESADFQPSIAKKVDIIARLHAYIHAPRHTYTHAADSTHDGNNNLCVLFAPL